VFAKKIGTGREPTRWWDEIDPVAAEKVMLADRGRAEALIQNPLWKSKRLGVDSA
jgi:hypothetical protein